MAEKKTILLRLSPRMWEEISKWADEEFRSVNGQIEYLLQQALVRNKRIKQENLKEEIEDNEA